MLSVQTFFVRRDVGVFHLVVLFSLDFPRLSMMSLRLGALVGKDMDRVLEVLDNSDIQWFRSIPSGRRFFRVQGSKNEQYVTTLFHCSCPGFTNQVVRENSHAMCKHQVACMLAEAVKPITCTDLRESDMVNELSSVQLHPSSGHWYGRGSFAVAMGHKTQEDAEFFHHQRT